MESFIARQQANPFSVSGHARLLLTGGTGFFGRAILRHLVATGTLSHHTVVVLSRDPKSFLTAYPEFDALAPLSFHRGDTKDRASLPWGEAFTHVLHAAADSTAVSQLQPLQRFHQILDGTANVLDLAVATGAKRFLFTSSGAIYGPQPADLNGFAEDWLGSPALADPATVYGQAKRSAEHLCALYREAHGLETVIARCFAFIGPDLPLDVHFAIGNFIRDALAGRSITIAGDGSPLRTYLDQTDLAHWLGTLLLEGHSGETYNVGSDEVISITELAHLVRDLIAPGTPVRILGRPDNAIARNRYIPNIEKARALHGLTVTVPLEQAILTTAQAHRKQPVSPS